MSEQARWKQHTIFSQNGGCGLVHKVPLAHGAGADDGFGAAAQLGVTVVAGKRMPRRTEASVTSHPLEL